jgi:hypothetical protein
MPGSNPKNPKKNNTSQKSKKSQKSQKSKKIKKSKKNKKFKKSKKSYRNHHRNPIDSLPLRVENSRKPWHLSAVQPFQAPLQRRASGAVVAQQQGAVGGAQDPGVACATGHPGKTWETRGKNVGNYGKNEVKL